MRRGCNVSKHKKHDELGDEEPTGEIVAPIAKTAKVDDKATYTPDGTNGDTWPATIVKIHGDGTVDLMVEPPGAPKELKTGVVLVQDAAETPKDRFCVLS
jgi:hypothetical protein